MDDVRVNLAQRLQRPWFALVSSADAQQQFAAVLFYVLVGVILGEAEIKSLASINGAEPACPGGEAVTKPGDFLQSRGVEGRQASSRFARGERRHSYYSSSVRESRWEQQRAPGNGLQVLNPQSKALKLLTVWHRHSCLCWCPAKNDQAQTKSVSATRSCDSNSALPRLPNPRMNQ